jgi:hypothetical protein
MSFGSDGGSQAPEGVFLKSSTHPRTYGNFARLLGKYVRDEKAATLPDAIRRLTSLPATNLSLKQRGWLKPGYYADVVVFDPATIQDHATFEKPQQLATGVDDVFVNGVQVLKNGKHTGAKPGRFVIPFIALRRRADGAVLVTAPALTGGMNMFGPMAQQMGGDAKSGPPSRAQGRLTIHTDGQIATNNSEDGAAADPLGRQVHWDIAPGTDKVPEALIRL